MSDVLTTSVADGVATLTLNRPDSLNALSNELKDALLEALLACESDDAVRVVVITGAGRAFCAGQDLAEHADSMERGAVNELFATIDNHFVPIVRTITAMPKPVVAALNGVAAGAGMSIACATDFRIAKESATFNSAFAGIGLSADTGITWTLPRLVGYARAKRLLMMPRPVTMDEASQIGLVGQVEPDDRFDTAVAEFAAGLAAGPTKAYAGIKASMHYGASHNLFDALDFEAKQMRRTGASEDHAAAVRAFMAKEKPTFSGV